MNFSSCSGLRMFAVDSSPCRIKLSPRCMYEAGSRSIAAVTASTHEELKNVS